MKSIEHEHQKALIEWARRTPLPVGSDVEPGATIAYYLLAIPNGGHRNKATAGKLKAEGVKPGVSDLLLPLRRQGFGSLWLELKAPGKKPTPEQREWLDRMARAGYRSEWADDWLKAAQIIADYCGVRPPLSQLIRGTECSASSATSPTSSDSPTRSRSAAAGAAGASVSLFPSRRATRSR